MRYAKYIGRVGGLAIALGVGFGIATGAPTAWAQTSDSSSSSAGGSTSADSSSDMSGATTTDRTDTDAATTDTTDTDAATSDTTDTDADTSGATVGAEATPEAATASDDDATAATGSAETATAEPESTTTGSESAVAQALTPEASQQVTSDTAEAAVDTNNAARTSLTNPTEAVSTLDDAPTADSTTEPVELTSTLETATATAPVEPLSSPSSTDDLSVQGTATAPEQVETTTEPTDAVTSMASVVGLAPTTDPTDPKAPVPAPIEAPMAWAVAAAARRQLETTAPTTEPATVDTSQSLTETTTFAALAAPANTAPQSPGATLSAPSATTGAITGSLNFTDPNGDPITYTVTEAPDFGALALSPDGTFTYTPTQRARLAAGSTLTSDVDQFTVNASDGTAASSLTVSPEIYSGQMSTSTQTAPVGYGPTAMTISGNRMYVANTVGNTVSVLDVNNGASLATVPVASRPQAVVVSPDGGTLYVTNNGSNAVTAHNTTTGAIVGVIPVAAPQGLAISPAGDRLYVSSIATNRVSVLNPATGATIATVATGTTPVGIAVNSDGSRVYVANRGSGTVSTIDAATNRIIGTTTVGSLPQQVALSTDGSRLYVTNAGSASVSVVDTDTFANLTTISVGQSPNGIALSRDGSLAYVVNGNNTMSVIDTATTTRLTGTVYTETGALGQVAVTPDGSKLYVSNSSGNFLRSISLIHVDPPPVTGNPSIGPLFEDFNGPAGSVPNPDIWRYSLGAGGSGGQLQAFTDSPNNASLDGNGNLVITARQETVYDPIGGTWNYTSAWLDTQDRFEFTYGTVSARIDFPASQGLHPTFWLLGSDYDQVGWPQAGEIDILDQFNDAGHAGSGLHGPGYYEVTRQAPIDVTDGFHEYTMRWEPNKITMFIDGQQTAVYTPDSLPPGTPWTFNDRSMYLILDLAVGGIGGPPNASTQFPQSVVVDWVRYTPLEGSGVTAQAVSV